MCKLVYVLAVNLQLLASYRIFWSAIFAARFRCLYAAWTKRVKEAVLPFRGVRGEGGCRSGVFFFEIVPLSLSAPNVYTRSFSRTCILVF
jgi:hypothetical protein